MGFALQLDHSPSKSVRELASDQLHQALDDLGRPDVHQAVHEARKRVKRLRGLLRLVRDTAPGVYRRENRALRDAARKLSALRDREALVECTDRMLAAPAGIEEREALELLRGELVSQRDEATGDPTLVVDEARKSLAKVRDRASQWKLRLDDEALAHGLARTYGRGRKAMKRALRRGRADDFHEWRKRAKYARYQHECLGPVWPEMMSAWADAYKTLSDRLGDHHDLAVLKGSIDEVVVEPGAASLLHSAVERHRRKLERECAELGRRVHSETAEAFEQRVATWLRIRRAELGAS